MCLRYVLFGISYTSLKRQACTKKEYSLHHSWKLRITPACSSEKRPGQEGRDILDTKIPFGTEQVDVSGYESSHVDTVRHFRSFYRPLSVNSRGIRSGDPQIENNKTEPLKGWSVLITNGLNPRKDTPWTLQDPSTTYVSEWTWE